MIHEHFSTVLAEKFGFDFSPTQQGAVEQFISFFFRQQEENVFLLRGYAGTGKTSLVAAMVNVLSRFNYSFVLLAPTGRAAKVFSAYSGQAAFTIHKKIYRQQTEQEGITVFGLGFNTLRNTLFFVDEASMIGMNSVDSHFGSGSLLDDLFQFVYNGRGNRLMLIGDSAQLPPIGTTLSPALEADFLRRQYDVEVYEANLTDIMRQSETSGVVYNATRIREMLEGGAGRKLQMKTARFPDIVRIGGGELLEELDRCYSLYGEDETMVICRSNRQANRYNAGIRSRILYREEDITAGDKVMIVKNNYYWGAAYENVDFIANGEIATILKVVKQTELYGFHFAYARLTLYGYETEITAWIMLDTLTSEQPALSREDSLRLYQAIEEDFQDIPSRKKRYKKIQENEYYNAFQIKFAYAVTGHKSQGGQWDAVFIDPGWYSEESPDEEYWRWLYTVFTRTRKQLLLIHFKEEWFGEE